MLTNCLDQWAIDSSRVLMIISDNGANVVKAMKILQQKETYKRMNENLEKCLINRSKAGVQRIESRQDEEPGTGNQESDNEGNNMQAEENQEMSDNESVTVNDENLTATETEEESESDPEDSHTLDNCDNNNESCAADYANNGSYETFLPIPDNVQYRRMPCMAHTLQLIVKGIYKTTYMHIITKTRQLVGQIRKLSVAVEKLVQVVARMSQVTARLAGIAPT